MGTMAWTLAHEINQPRRATANYVEASRALMPDAGTIKFLEKPFDRTSLLAAADQAFAHARQSNHSQIDAAEAVTRLHVLTARGRDVLEGMVQGQPNNVNGYALDIASRTVEIQRANLMAKLGCRSLSDVLRIAFAAGLGLEKQTSQPS